MLGTPHSMGSAPRTDPRLVMEFPALVSGEALQRDPGRVVGPLELASEPVGDEGGIVLGRHDADGSRCAGLVDVIADVVDEPVDERVLLGDRLAGVERAPYNDD